MSEQETISMSRALREWWRDRRTAYTAIRALLRGDLRVAKAFAHDWWYMVRYDPVEVDRWLEENRERLQEKYKDEP